MRALRDLLADLAEGVKEVARIVIAVAAGLLIGLVLFWVGGRPVAVALLVAVVIVCLVILARAVRATPNYCAPSEGYEKPGTTPTHVREPGTVEGTVLPEKRLPHA